MSIVFTASRFVHNTICLIQYYPYRVRNDEGDKIVNPKFDEKCGQLLNVKGDPANRNYATSVAVFGNQLAKTLKDYAPLTGLASIDIAIIPKSEAGRVSPGLVAVAERLCALDKRFVLPRQQILTRTKTIEKLANGGNRAKHIHHHSINVTLPRTGRAVLLLDDIGTTGNSIMACTELLYVAGVARVFPVVLGRTK